jgi:hypothetical protein
MSSEVMRRCKLGSLYGVRMVNRLIRSDESRLREVNLGPKTVTLEAFF